MCPLPLRIGLAQINTIVGDLESDVKSGKISYTSPIGRAMIGKSSGDEVKVETPSGRREFEIINIEYR